MKEEFKNLVQTSISSLIKAGVVKSVSVDQLNQNDRLIATLEGKNSTFAEVLIGRDSSEIIYKNGGLSERMINESTLVLLEDRSLGDNLRFTTTEYTNLDNMFEIPKDKKTKDAEAKQLSSIITILESYWKK
jgi:hypothetical protein